MKNIFPNSKPKLNKGFTLVETLVAILILAMAIGALLTLTAGGFFSIRYSKNEIVANNLLQESLEFIRNHRDTLALSGASWEGWVDEFRQKGCFDADGCIVNPYAVAPDLRILPCTGDCDPMHFNADVSFYGYPGESFFDPSGSSTPYETSFIRTINMRYPNSGLESEVIVNAKMEWMNGTNRKEVNQSMILTKWNLQ